MAVTTVTKPTTLQEWPRTGLRGRIARFLLQETAGRVYKPMARNDWLPGAILASALVTAGWGVLVHGGSIATIDALRLEIAGSERTRQQYLSDRLGPTYGLAQLEAETGHPFEALAIIDHARARELVNGAGRKNAGILLDAYHLERTGAGGRGFEDVALEEIAAFQYSDVPASADPPLIERLVPGQGTVRWLEVFSLLKEKGYTGYLSYEAPNPDKWKRPAVDVAREAASATRAMLAKVN